jgi:hypothetical protein
VIGNLLNGFYSELHGFYLIEVLLEINFQYISSGFNATLSDLLERLRI